MPVFHAKPLSVGLAAVTAGLLAAGAASATPIASLAGLQSVIVYERTTGGAADPHIFAAGSTALTQQRGGTLSTANRDFETAVREYYDVFYSDADGTLNTLGSYITIEARFDDPFNFGGGGHNIAGVRLDFSGGATEFADRFVAASLASFGQGAFPNTAGNAVDGDLDTHTFLGETTPGDPTRLSITVGFASTAEIAEPAALGLFGLGLVGLGLAARRRRAG